MNVLLVGNYAFNYQQSMQKFALVLEKGLHDAGHEVQVIRPKPVLGRLRPGEHGLGKWLGYIDKFLLFPFLLRRAVKWADIVHICDHANAMYVSHLRGIPHVVTCHDMMAIRAAAGEIEQARPGFTGRLFQAWILRGLKKADVIACVSQQTAKELAEISGVSGETVCVVPNSFNYPYSPMPAEQSVSILAGLGLPQGQPYFLHVGGNQWYKNRLGALRIFYELARYPAFSGYWLVMAGKEWTEKMRSSVQASGLEERILGLENVDNEQLRALYSQATTLVFPSLHEGFGWPIIEAQACGAVVATTNASPMKDVAGKDAAILFDPEDASGAAAAISEALAVNSAFIRQMGMQNAVQYSVESMINGYLAAYGRALVRAQA